MFSRSVSFLTWLCPATTILTLDLVLQRIGDIEQEWINERGPPPKFGYHDLEPPCDPFDSSKDVLDKDAFDTTDYDRPDNTTSSEESISGWESD